MFPRVSIIVAAYNARDYVEVALRSALNQTERNIEILVIDDGSSDGTAEIVRTFSDPRLRLFVLDQNRGQSHARNVGIREARGEWVTFLDADDWYATNRFEILLRVGEKWQADIVADDMFRTADPSDPAPRTKLEKLQLTQPQVIDAAGFLLLNSGLKPVIRRDLLSQHKIFFEEGLRYGEDTLLLLECLMSGGKLVLWPEPLYYYREREGSLTTFRVETLVQRRRTTQALLKRSLVQKDSSLRTVLQDRLDQTEEALRYFRVVEPLRAGKIGEALRAGLFKPSFLLLFIKAVPKVLNNRIWRHLSPHT